MAPIITHKIPNQRASVGCSFKNKTANMAPNSGYVAKMEALIGTPAFIIPVVYNIRPKPGCNKPDNAKSTKPYIFKVLVGLRIRRVGQKTIFPMRVIIMTHANKFELDRLFLINMMPTAIANAAEILNNTSSIRPLPNCFA